MQENSLNSGGAPVTQPSIAPWSEEERALIATFVWRKARRHEIEPLFPGRSFGAVKKRLSEERRRQGVPIAGQLAETHERQANRTTVLHPKDPGLYAPDWRIAAAPALAQNNAAFLAALCRMAA